MLSAYVSPPLTSLDISIFDLGFEATKFLLEKVRNTEAPVVHHLVETNLIELESCKNIG